MSTITEINGESKFVQCKNENEAEAAMKKLKAGFVSPDHRVYSEIEFWDDACILSIPAKTPHALYDLQSHIDLIKDGDWEMNGFDDVVSTAKDLQKAFNAAIKALSTGKIVKRARQ